MDRKDYKIRLNKRSYIRVYPDDEYRMWHVQMYYRMYEKSLLYWLTFGMFGQMQYKWRAVYNSRTVFSTEAKHIQNAIDSVASKRQDKVFRRSEDLRLIDYMKELEDKKCN